MENDIADYGILVSVCAAKYTYLFVDDTDRERYIAVLIRMITNGPPDDAVPVIAGLHGDTAQILFHNGYEESLRNLFRRIHTSYAAYRKTKNCPIHFGRASYELLDGKHLLADARKKIRDNSDYICIAFDAESLYPPPGTLIRRVKSLPGYLTETKLLELAHSFGNHSTLDTFFRSAALPQKSGFAKALRAEYKLSYHEIGKIMHCSRTTAYRIVNKAI